MDWENVLQLSENSGIINTEGGEENGRKILRETEKRSGGRSDGRTAETVRGKQEQRIDTGRGSREEERLGGTESQNHSEDEGNSRRFKRVGNYEISYSENAPSDSVDEDIRKFIQNRGFRAYAVSDIKLASGKELEGFSTGRDIYYDAKGDKWQITGHELLHALKRGDRKGYEALKQRILKGIDTENYNRLVEIYEELYGSVYDKTNDEDIIEEIIADIAGSVLSEINSVEGVAITEDMANAINEYFDSAVTDEFVEGESGLVEEAKFSIKKTFNPKGIRLTKQEYAKAQSAISTNYYSDTKTHEGLQYQSAVTDKDHIVYLYYDGGFDTYQIVGKINFETDEALAIEFMEAIDNGEVDGTARTINRFFKVSKTRQSRNIRNMSDAENGRPNSRVRELDGGQSTGYRTQSEEEFQRNTGRTSDESGRDINDVQDGGELKFKLESPVEETRDLIAQHNLRAEDLLGSFDLETGNGADRIEKVNETDEVKFSVKISKQDVDAIKSIGTRKSVNQFTGEEINKTSGFAQKYYQELGAKSPFFRAWFGDWRANDKTPVHVVTEKGNQRGAVQNRDTGWSINNSSQLHNEIHGNVSGIIGRDYLQYANSIIENSILLNSSVSDKGNNSIMFHDFYAITKKDGDKDFRLIKLLVEELYNPSGDTIKRAYKLIGFKEISPMVQKVHIQKELAFSLIGDNSSISDLFNLVKTYDKDFQPAPSSVVINKDGTPKIMYRGDANEEIEVFDRKKSRASNLYGRGFYFTENKNHASQYGTAYAYCLDIKTPLSPGQNNITKEQMYAFLEAVAENEDDYDIWNYGTTDVKEILGRVYGKGDFEMIQDVSATAIGDLVEAVELFNKVNGTDYDGLVLPYETVVFNSTQIKSVDNFGTFNKSDDRVKFKVMTESELKDEYAQLLLSLRKGDKLHYILAEWIGKMYCNYLKTVV